MTPLMGAFVTYVIKLVIFSLVAALGIAVGIQLRKKKDNQ